MLSRNILKDLRSLIGLARIPGIPKAKFVSVLLRFYQEEKTPDQRIRTSSKSLKLVCYFCMLFAC